MLDSVLINNNNIHTITGFKPSFLIKNDDEEIYNTVVDNIKKVFKFNEEKNKEYYLLKEGDHLISKNGPFKKGKVIKCRRTKYKTDKLPLTVLKNYFCGVISEKVDENLYNFIKDEIFLIEPNACKKINDFEWNAIIDDLKKKGRY